MTAQARLTENIRELLRFTRRTQADLAAHIKVSQPHISQMLSGKRQWQIEDFDLIADFFCVTVSDLFRNGHGAMERRSGRERRSGLDRRRRTEIPHRQIETGIAADEPRSPNRTLVPCAPTAEV